VVGKSAESAATSGATTTIVINGVEIGTVTSQGDLSKDRTATIDMINAKAGQTGVTAEDNGNGITLKAADGRNISVAVDATTAEAFGLSGDGIGAGYTPAAGSSGSVAAVASNFSTTAVTTYSTVRLESATSINISGGSAGTTG